MLAQAFKAAYMASHALMLICQVLMSSTLQALFLSINLHTAFTAEFTGSGSQMQQKASHKIFNHEILLNIFKL